MSMNVHEAQTVAVYAQRIKDNKQEIVQDRLLTEEEATNLINLLESLIQNISQRPGVNLQ